MRKKGRGGESRVDGSEMAGNPWTRPDLAAAVVAGWEGHVNRQYFGNSRGKGLRQRSGVLYDLSFLCYNLHFYEVT
jgi:hypothetical protein